MKKFLYIILLGFIFLIPGKASAQCNDELLNVCYPSLGEFKYLKSWPVKIKKNKKKGAPPSVLRFNVVLNGGYKYILTACDAEEYEGKVVISLYSGNALVGSSYDAKTNKDYKKFIFDCKKSGVYYVSFYFIDGEEGCAIGVLGQQEMNRK
ncbi:MAG: hypothetical protein KKA07_07265 [Bacteroidetes bacterium]|nr:hypothetical protein [Bacteroidota bacterium]MBU1718859.1 hypothetical protein [Bacteroidota bacterium]